MEEKIVFSENKISRTRFLKRTLFLIAIGIGEAWSLTSLAAEQTVQIGAGLVRLTLRS